MKRIVNKRKLRADYNRLVKTEYKVAEADEKFLQDEAKSNAEEKGMRPYIEIPSYMSKSGHTELLSY